MVKKGASKLIFAEGLHDYKSYRSALIKGIKTDRKYKDIILNNSFLDEMVRLRLMKKSKFKIQHKRLLPDKSNIVIFLFEIKADLLHEKFSSKLRNVHTIEEIIEHQKIYRECLLHLQKGAKKRKSFIIDLTDRSTMDVRNKIVELLNSY